MTAGLGGLSLSLLLSTILGVSAETFPTCRRSRVVSGGGQTDKFRCSAAHKNNNFKTFDLILDGRGAADHLRTNRSETGICRER